MKPKTLRDMIASLQRVADANPAALDYLVVSSRDDEGNGYNVVFYDAGETTAADLRAGYCDVDNYREIDDDARLVIIN